MLPTSLYKELDRLSDPVRWNFHAERSDRHIKTDIIETEESYELVLALPGLKEHEIEISVERTELIIAVNPEQVEDDKVKYIKRELNPVATKKTFKLPDYIDRNSIGADLKDGLLKVTLRKGEDFQPKKIKVAAK
ncbi:MAG: Hsp20/alpha crystallin family protein [Pseudobacteriovorax sp.]|nr:Hsp20/alpha crystallin family protein [Pseudobacteriovorax sp.]